MQNLSKHSRPKRFQKNSRPPKTPQKGKVEKNEHDSVDKLKNSLIKFRFVIFPFFTLPQRVLISHVLMVLFVNRNVKNVDFVMNFVVDILFLLFDVLLEISRLTVFKFLQLMLQTVVLLSYFVDYLEQLFNLKSFLVLWFAEIMTVQLFFEPINLYFFLIYHPIFHLH